MKKSRFLYIHREANPGKIAALDALQEEYTNYLKVCVETMLKEHRFKIPLWESRVFFSPCGALSSQIVKNVRAHAGAIVSGWAASKYVTTLRRLIRSKFKAGEIDEATRSALCILGKCLVAKPGGTVTQEAIDLYWSWLLDEGVVGKTPTVSNRCGMRMSEMTAVLETSDDTKLASWWLGFSHLNSGKARIQVPLVPSPYAKNVSDVSKGILARKDRRDRWRLEVVDRKEWDVQEAAEEMPRVGVDVGLNVMAATSDGRLFGADLKPKFNSFYKKVRRVRANRQRQGFKENSPRLDRLESRLSGMVKTYAGATANKLVEAYPDHAFVVEDLNLRGCRGQKRFAYKALHKSLEMKAPTIVVNPAYTSQTCPSCEYGSRSNRSGIKFHCRSCGRKSHADVVGAINLLRRSEDKQVDLDDRPSEVKVLLRERYLFRRRLVVKPCSRVGAVS